jgi:ribosomal protein S18 acetylase RimI-like enzyme
MLIDQARELWAAKKMTLAVFEHNITALNLYNSLGFQRVSKELFFPNDHTAWQLVKMEKKL